jgi:hypothetical protein
LIRYGKFGCIHKYPIMVWAHQLSCFENFILLSVFNSHLIPSSSSMPNKWRVCKDGQAGNKKRQRRGLLVLSEPPRLPSAGRRPDCFHTFLGCKPRSFIRLFWAGSIIQKNVRKDSLTPAD